MDAARTQTANTGAPTDIKRTRARLHLRALFLTLTFLQRLARKSRCEERQTGKKAAEEVGPGGVKQHQLAGSRASAAPPDCGSEFLTSAVRRCGRGHHPCN